MNKKKLTGIILFIVLFLSGVAGGYLYFSKVFSKERSAEKDLEHAMTQPEIFFVLRIYYPVRNHLLSEERRLPKRIGQIPIAEATVEEFLKGPVDAALSVIPRDAKLLELYKGADSILYVDLSDEFRRNFQGDAVSELLLLKGLYVSLVSNIPDFQDVKVLIEGKEVETLGGHFYLLHPLKDMVSPEVE